MLESDFFGRGRNLLVVQAGAAQAQELGLLAQRQLVARALDQFPAFIASQGRGQIFFSTS